MLDVGYVSDKGLVRENNEDNLYVNPEKGIFIVADGMGGHNAGEVASEIAVDQIKKGVVDRIFSSEDIGKLLEEAIKEANKRVYQKALENERFNGMGTTVAAAVVKQGRLYIAHVGDSRAYLFNNEGLKPLTEDHTVAIRMLKQGLIKDSELKGHPMGNALTKAVGIEDDVEAAIIELSYQGETVLLCSDGLTDMVEDEEIARALLTEPDLQRACSRLVEIAKQHGGRDNITVAVFRGEEG